MSQNPDRDVEYEERIAICMIDGNLSEKEAIEIAEKDYQERMAKKNER